MTALSVVVPCYRAEAHLAQCLDSVLAYEGDDLELIAVDDGSPSVLARYAERDARVRVVPLPTNDGPGPARNAGLAHATGEYVWFVDADDWLPAGAVAAVLETLAAKPDVLVVGYAEVFGAEAVARPDGLVQSVCTKVIRRELVGEFPPGWYEDVPVALGALLAAERVEELGRVAYYYRQQTAGSITSSVSDRHFDIFDRYEGLFATDNGPELFRTAIDHYLVVLGHRARVPSRRRREFFQRIVTDYRRWLPAGGYPAPSGVGRLKHWLVRSGAYRSYAALRLAYRLYPRSERRGR
jgi:CDP-glycerol glycerophosphotransferase